LTQVLSHAQPESPLQLLYKDPSGLAFAVLFSRCILPGIELDPGQPIGNKGEIACKALAGRINDDVVEIPLSARTLLDSGDEVDEPFERNS
jgi:hypothetical protein